MRVEGLSTRQYLKKLDKLTLRKLLKICDLSETEYWLLIYAFVEERMRENTCAKLSIGKSKYHTMINEALIGLLLIFNYPIRIKFAYVF